MQVAADVDEYDEEDDDDEEDEEFMGMMMNEAGGFYGGADDGYYPHTTWDLVVKNATPKLPQLDIFLHKYQNQMRNRKFFTS